LLLAGLFSRALSLLAGLFSRAIFRDLEENVRHLVVQRVGWCGRVGLCSGGTQRRILRVPCDPVAEALQRVRLRWMNGDQSR